MTDTLAPVRQALHAGDKQRARELLRPLLKQPSAERWYLAAYACDSRAKALDCLRRALRFDPAYEPARHALAKLEARERELPSLEMLVNVPAADQTLRAVSELAPLRHARRERKRSAWTTIGCAGSILLSVSSAYFVLTVLGSPLPAQFRAVVDRLTGGNGAQTGEGTPVFGLPAGENSPSGAGDAAGENGAPRAETADRTSRQAAGGFVVRPNKSVELQPRQAVSDVLDAGYAHEYTFDARQGDELAVGIQFFSPTAGKVGANAAVLDPDGLNAESRCQRDAILNDGSSVAFICQAHKTGRWKLHVFGRDGESTGVYVVTFERM